MGLKVDAAAPEVGGFADAQPMIVNEAEHRDVAQVVAIAARGFDQPVHLRLGQKALGTLDVEHVGNLTFYIWAFRDGLVRLLVYPSNQ